MTERGAVEESSAHIIRAAVRNAIRHAGKPGLVGWPSRLLDKPSYAAHRLLRLLHQLRSRSSNAALHVALSEVEGISVEVCFLPREKVEDRRLVHEVAVPAL